MSATIMEEQLLAALAADSALAEAGCTAARLPGGGVAITSGSATIGVWAWRAGYFALEPIMPGLERLRVETVAEAVQRTRAVIFGGR